MIDINRVISSYLKRAIDYKLALLLATFTQFLGSCSAEKETTTVEKFPVIFPAKMDTLFSKEYVADIQSIQNVELRSRVSGFLEQIHVDEGHSVKAGQLLFTLSSQVFRDELQKANAVLKSARAEAKVAELEVKNTQRLVDKNIVSITELELAEAKMEAISARIDEALSAVSTAELSLSFTSVRAPFDGVINRIPNKQGSLIEEGTLLTTISNNDEVFAYFNLSEAEYLDFLKRNNLEKNEDIILFMANDQRYDKPGRIETVESEIDKGTGTIAIRARFPNPSHVLKHGASGKVLLNTRLKDALLVPQKSTFEIQENLYVYVVNKDNVVQMRRITPRIRMPHLYVIDSGLSSDELIIYEGIQRVTEGEKISPEPLSNDKGFSNLAQSH